MATDLRKFLKGIKLVPTSSTAIDSKGELEVLDSNGKLNYYNGTSASAVVTADHAETLTNKSIDSDNNTITNIVDADIKSSAAIARSKIATGTADYVLINDVSGNFSEEQHLAKSRGGAGADMSSVTFPSTGTLVTEAGVQTLTNKTIDADNNTITNIENADIKAAAAIARTKLASGTADYVVINNGTGVMSEEQHLAKSRGGAGADMSSVTFPASGTLVTEAGTQTLTNKTLSVASNTINGLTSGSVAVAGASGEITEDNAGLYFDVTANELGVNTASPNTTVDVAGDFAIRQSNDATSGTIDALGTDGISSIRLTAASTVTLRGIANGVDGKYLTVANVTGNTLTISNENGTPTAANRIVTGKGADVSISDGGSALLQYDATTSRWRMVTSVDTAGGGGGSGVASGGVTAKSADYTILAGDDGKVIAVDTSGGAHTMTLPSPSAGFLITIKDATGNATTNNITIARAGTEDVDSTAGDPKITTNYDSLTLISDGTDWYRISHFTGEGIPVGRAVFAGGPSAGATSSNVLDYVEISVASNATDFGDLTTSRAFQFTSGCGSTTRGLNAGGTSSNVIDYITIATTGNAVDFGDLTSTRSEGGACSNSTRGCFWGGTSPSNVIDYVTISSTGNATDFGDMTDARGVGACFASSTRGIFAGGNPVTVNVIEYITIATTGNATDFGDLRSAKPNVTGSSDGTIGLIATNQDAAGDIDVITIATTGNSSDWGGANSASTSNTMATGNSIRAVWAGGIGGNTNVIEYHTYDSAGAATDFGDLTSARGHGGAVSDSHGGLQ